MTQRITEKAVDAALAEWQSTLGAPRPRMELALAAALPHLQHGEAADASRTPDFEGQALWDLVVDIEGAIGSHAAGATPLGRAVTALCEDKILADPWVQKTKFNRDPQTSHKHGEP